ncbi:hypothetical protein ANN_18519 [Periplaneta americana]|uniref:Uncharacterized protein n=1 Tax=Periplaneta americana TaxID=6978 RepID=A0ABQ8SNZ4_PERAM|nr:hypothetical protein ANN_18519 [Periplaneta americana]
MMAADADCHHLCKLMAPVRHRWSINDVIGGIRNTVMPSDCSPSDLTILGSPVFLEGVETIAEQKLLALKTLFDRLLSLNPHISYFLLKNCSVFLNDEVEICYLPEALDRWNDISRNSNPPAHPDVQNCWDDIIIRHILESLVTSCTSETDQARLLALPEKEAGSWLQALLRLQSLYVLDAKSAYHINVYVGKLSTLTVIML